MRPIPFTSPDNLQYPASTDNTHIWEHIQALATSVQTALTAVGAQTWNSWTPTWDTAGGGGFTGVGGSGVNQGFYTQIGNLIHAEFRVELASGFSVDTGTFVLMLPVAAYAFGGAVLQQTIGTWTARDDSAPNHWSGTLGTWSNDHDRVSFNGAWDGTSPKKRIDSNDPFVWAAGDVLSGNLSYRRA